MMNICLDILILAIFLVPIIVGVRKGFVHTLLRFGKTVIALILSCSFAKALGGWIKSKWMYASVHKNITSLFAEEGATTASEADLVAALPDSIQKTLSFFGMDVNSMASEAAAKEDAVIERFVESVSHGVSGVVSFVLAFALLFFGSLLLIFLLRPLVDWLAGRIPVVNTCNRLLGALFGVLWGVVAAWVGAQIIVGILGLVAYIDWSNTVFLSFFYRITPLRWLLRFIVQSIVSISVL